MKKIIALASALAMVLPMAVVSAKTVPSEKGITVVYDATASTADTAVVEVYAKGVKALGTTIENFTLNFDLNTEYVDVAAGNANASERIVFDSSVKSGNKNANIINQSSRKQLMLGLVDADGASWDETKPIITVSLPLTDAGKSITSPTQIMTHNTAGNRYKITVDGNSYTSDFSATIDDVCVQGAEVEVAGTETENEGEKATYWTAEANLVSDATPYWYATVNDAAKKVKANVPSVSGAAKLGLIVEGDDVVTNVKIVQE